MGERREGTGWETMDEDGSYALEEWHKETNDSIYYNE